jgi:hypothetical protein
MLMISHCLDNRLTVIRVRVTLQLTVSQSVRLGVEPDFGTFDQRYI